MAEKDSKAYMYVVECADGTLYTGYTTEPAYQLNSSTQKPLTASLKP